MYLPDVHECITIASQAGYTEPARAAHYQLGIVGDELARLTVERAALLAALEAAICIFYDKKEDRDYEIPISFLRALRDGLEREETK